MCLSAIGAEELVTPPVANPRLKFLPAANGSNRPETAVKPSAVKGSKEVFNAR
jgi:hypothetical protein